MKNLTLIILTLISTAGMAQKKVTSEGEVRVRISTLEKQNKVAKDIPRLLLQAWCKGDINAYYPKNQNVELTYAQFLEHFGMEKRAYTVLDNQVPEWFCEEQPLECIPIDPYTMQCLQYEVELGEENYFNKNTARQEKKLEYIKLIYSSNCTVRGIEIEGPVLKINDIKKLPKSYKVTNPENDASALPIWSYLTLGNYRRSTIYKKEEFVTNPARIAHSELQNRLSSESENWEK